MAILSIMVINNHGQPRLLKFYHEVPHNQREQVVREAFSLVSKRSDSICNFLEGSDYWGGAVKLIYRHYATLYFVVAVDSSESELGILDLIQVFVEALDKCLSGDHMALTRSGWRSLVDIHGEVAAAQLAGAALPSIEVASFNRATSAMEWKRVEAAQRVPAGRPGQRLFRMQGDGMDVVATEDHSMLTGRLAHGTLAPGSFDFEAVSELAGLPYSKRERLPHSHTRAVVRSAVNRQPAFKLAVKGLEETCDWWWRQDQQHGFLRFLGFWLGDGHLVVTHGFVGLSQRKLASTAWLMDSLDELFPRWWRRGRDAQDDKGVTFLYNIRCPPLYEWLRLKAVGPPGYNPLDDAQLRAYPHFQPGPGLAAVEAVSTYGRRREGHTWSQAAMLSAFGAGPRRRACCVCSKTDGVRLSCSGTRCDDVDAITRAHPACVGRDDTAAFEQAWFCDQCQEDEAEEHEVVAVALTADDGEARARRREELEGDLQRLEDEKVKRRRTSSSSSSSSSSASSLSRSSLSSSPSSSSSSSSVEEAAPVWAVAARQFIARGVVWNHGEWDIDIDGDWFYRKRWMGVDVAGTIANLSQSQAVALLEGFCRADGTLASIRFDGGEPTGVWRCTNSSFPLIHHLQLVGLLAGASCDLSIHSKKGKKTVGFVGRSVATKVDHWALDFSFNKIYHAQDVSVSRLAKPVDVTNDMAARGYFGYEDDGYVYDLTVADNHNFLTQRLSTTRVKAGKLAVKAYPLFVGNCFANVCELDLIFHTDRIHFILDEIVMGGMVLETSLKEILKAVNGSNKYQRDTQSAAEQKTTVIGKKMQS